jgi:hypothetical protein
MLGPEAVKAVNPHHRPAKAAKSPAPMVHASSEAKRKWWRSQYALLVHAYRALMEEIGQGLRREDAAQPFAWCAGIPWPRVTPAGAGAGAAAPS